MKIVTYHSENAPPSRSWVAYWQVPVREKPVRPGVGSPEEQAISDAFKSPPSEEGMLPYSFWGASEQEVTAQAQDAWTKSFGRLEKKPPIRTRQRLTNT